MKMNNSQITEAAKLIADIDPALAQVWLKSPFQRHNIVTAFHRSLTNCNLAPLADRIAVALRSAIDSNCGGECQPAAKCITPST